MNSFLGSCVWLLFNNGNFLPILAPKQRKLISTTTSKKNHREPKESSFCVVFVLVVGSSGYVTSGQMEFWAAIFKLQQTHINRHLSRFDLTRTRRRNLLAFARFRPVITHNWPSWMLVFDHERLASRRSKSHDKRGLGFNGQLDDPHSTGE